MRPLKFLCLFAGVLGFLIFTFWRYKEEIAIKNLERQNRKFVSVYERLNRPRNFLDLEIRKILPEPQASLMSGIILGTKASFPAELYNAMKRSGVIHVIALSGQNISILVSVFFGFLLPVWGRRIAAIFSIIMVLAFILFVGPTASVVRAGIMGSLAMLALFLGKEYVGFIALTISGLVMILFDPTLLADIGFQLSFMASLGIMACGGNERSVWRTEDRKQMTDSGRQITENGEWVRSTVGANHDSPADNVIARSETTKQPRWACVYEIFIREVGKLISEIKAGVLNNLRVTLAAQIFTFPILTANFGTVSIVSPLVNVLVVWLVPFIMVYGALSALMALVFFDLGRIMALIVWVPLTFFIEVAKFFAGFIYASIDLGKQSFSFGLIYYGVLMIILAIRNVRKG